MPEYYGPDIISTLAKRLRPFMQSVIAVTPAAGAFGKIIVIHANDGGTEYFDPSGAGFTSALAAASAGDAVWLPPATISGNHTIPTSVGVQAYGKKTDLTGTITLSSGSFLQSCYVIPTLNDATTLKGIIGPSSGTAYLADCSIIVTQNGSGDAKAIDAGVGDVWCWASRLEAVSGSGTAYALQAGDGDIYAWYCRLKATSSGADSNPISSGGVSGEVLVSEVGEGKALNLWNGSSNDAEPSGWYELTYDDSSWDATVAASLPPPLSGTQSVCHSPAYQWPFTPRKNLIRHEFTLASQTDLRLQMRIEDWIPLGVYVNEVLVQGAITDPAIDAAYNTVDVNIDSGDTIAGTNLLAFEVQNGDGSKIGASYRLDASGSGGAVFVYACEIKNTDGAETAEAMLGDRSAFDVSDYSSYHASDILNDVLLRHLPEPGTSGNIVSDDGTNWISQPGTEGAGLTVDLIAGENLSAGDLVDIYNDGGTAKARLADTSENYPADGYVKSAYSSSGTATIYLAGKVTGLAGMTPGAKQYLSTDGDPTETAPSTGGYIIQEVGIAVNATEMKFEPQQIILLDI